jgi:hypothetical protein
MRKETQQPESWSIPRVGQHLTVGESSLAQMLKGGHRD